MAEFSRIFSIAIKQGLLSLLGVLILIVVGQLLALGPSFIVGRTIDFLIDGRFSSVWWALGALLLLASAKLVFSPWQSSVVAKFVQEAVLRFSQESADAIFDKQYRLFESSNVGGVIKRSERGIEGVEGFLNFIIVAALPAVAALVIITTCLAVITGWQILALLALAAVAFIFVSNRIIRWRRPFIDAVNASEDSLAETYADSFAGAKSIKASGAVHELHVGLHRVFKNYAAKATRLALASGVLTSSQEFLSTVTIVAAIAIGTHILGQGTSALTVGDFVIIFNFVGTFMVSIGRLMELRKQFDQYSADMVELDKLIALPPVRPSTAKRQTLRGDLTLSAFEGLTEASLTLPTPFTFNRQDKVLVIGETGSGKSTFLEVIAALNSFEEVVAVGGQDLGLTHYGSVTEHIFYLPQKPVFLEGNFQRAVLFGQRVERSKLVRLMDQVGLSKFRATLDAKAFDSTQLSGGERKRFALLRALVAHQPVVIVDEPTSEIDDNVAEQVWDTILTELSAKTLICASHDVGVSARFDKTLTVHQGCIMVPEA